MSNENKSNDINLDSYFTESTIDNNKNSIVDLNVGLVNLFAFFNEKADDFSEVQRYLVAEYEEGYPDLVALHSAYGDQAYWWWLMLLNRLEDPLTDIKDNWVYSINSSSQVNNFINDSNNIQDANKKSRAGTIVELN